MSKTHIYFMPGLAAGPEIFEKLTLNKECYDFHYLEWIEPLSLDESLLSYTNRMSKHIKHSDIVLIGVSFGGILVQEISRIINAKKVIIISSVKSHHEFPNRIKLAKKSKAYKLFPTTIVTNFEDYEKYFIGKSLEKKAEIYKKYISVRGETYLKWAIHNVVNWEQKEPLQDLLHIHGTKDSVFPIKHIKDSIEIEGGTHAMIIVKAKLISNIIHKSLTC